jgi:hypothetical protein
MVEVREDTGGFLRNLHCFHRRNFRFLGHACLVVAMLAAEGASQERSSYYVDESGTLRETETQKEVSFFGVNYTVPFAHAYRAHDYLGVAQEASIDADVYHMARLGFDAYRLHVWDCEISDEQGNLLFNEHLRLFDYLIFRLKERGIKSIVTFIFFGSNGYPERPTEVPGFARLFNYDKRQSILNPETVKAQGRYIEQFVNHVNPYTNIAYGKDPDIVGFELNNEPNNGGEPERTKAYINEMVAIIRNSGCNKPVFYNVSQSPDVYEAICSSSIQGCAFQWYPSGLVANHEQKGNLLPNVDHYVIPFSEHADFKNKARIVYEFDAADVGGSYMYPAMARSFREAGFQWATQFAYDPFYLAPVNTEYQTHYLNLAYTPQKALSMKIASAVFHTIPRESSFGEFPANQTFGDFRVSYEEDLSEMVTETLFFYSGNTATKPPSPDKIKTIAGYGNSPLVEYGGRGAYFLDQLEPGIWRLELMPDAIPVHDPFERASPKKQVTVIKWKQWPMWLRLPDLGGNFSVQPVNDGNTHKANGSEGKFEAFPGVYLLKGANIRADQAPAATFGNIKINEYYAPKSSGPELVVLHRPKITHDVRLPLLVKADVVSEEGPAKVELVSWGDGAGWRTRKQLEMKPVAGYTYQTELTAEALQSGGLHYFIVVHSSNGMTTFPGNVDGHPYDWDFHFDGYATQIVSRRTPIVLFDATNAAGRLVTPHFWGNIRYQSKFQLSEENGRMEWHFEPENMDTGFRDLTFGYYCGDLIAERDLSDGGPDSLMIRARSLSGTDKLQVALVTKRGRSYGTIIRVEEQATLVRVPLEALQEGPYVLLPRPYPTFQSYWRQPDKSNRRVELAEVEMIQISIGPGLEDLSQKHAYAIERIWLQ